MIIIQNIKNGSKDFFDGLIAIGKFIFGLFILLLIFYGLIKIVILCL